MGIGALSSEKEWKFNIGRGAALQRVATTEPPAGSHGKEAASMDPKSREPKKDRPKTHRPPATARTPKGDESQDVGDVERATQRDERDFDPNVNQRPR
jgi:hypothetical protein